LQLEKRINNIKYLKGEESHDHYLVFMWFCVYKNAKFTGKLLGKYDPCSYEVEGKVNI
jgi:hypothetical protein